MCKASLEAVFVGTDLLMMLGVVDVGDGSNKKP